MIRIRKSNSEHFLSGKAKKTVEFISRRNLENKLKLQAETLKECLQNKNDGLQYARLLQEAIFHDPDTLNLIFPESFIFYSSKDIIGGDFYWFEKINGKAFVACADCTGHGVPGAMLSVLGLSKLNGIISSLEFPPSKILDKLNSIIYNALGKKHTKKKMNDGMDMALYCIDMETKILNYSGALNPLCIVRNGTLIMLEADKQSIGQELEIKPFANQSFQLQKGDMLYTFSDGYGDQFGGDKGKKFTKARFKNLLTTIAANNIDEQKECLKKTLEDWMQGQEQTDDICVIGVRIQ